MESSRICLGRSFLDLVHFESHVCYIQQLINELFSRLSAIQFFVDIHVQPIDRVIGPLVIPRLPMMLAAVPKDFQYKVDMR